MATSSSVSNNLVTTGPSNNSSINAVLQSNFVVNETSENGPHVIIGVCVLFVAVMIATIIIAVIMKIRRKSIKFINVSDEQDSSHSFVNEDSPESRRNSLKNNLSFISTEQQQEKKPQLPTSQSPSSKKCRLKKTTKTAATIVDSTEIKSLPSRKTTIVDLSQLLSTDEGISELKKEFKNIPVRQTDSAQMSEGEKPENKTKNLYPNIIPFDFNQVVLATGIGQTGSDYINASKITLTREYIAAQAPRNKTRGDFWRMIMENDVRVIVNLTKLMDGNRKLCSCYWPTSKKAKAMEGFSVQNNKEQQQDYEEFTEYALSYQQDQSQSKREVVLLHFFEWPSKGLPQVEAILQLRQRLRELTQPKDVVLVHCSAGAGRTGTFIALDALLDEGRKSRSIDVLRCVSRLRMARPHLVQTMKQYIFLHQCIVTELTDA